MCKKFCKSWSHELWDYNVWSGKKSFFPCALQGQQPEFDHLCCKKFDLRNFEILNQIMELRQLVTNQYTEIFGDNSAGLPSLPWASDDMGSWELGWDSCRTLGRTCTAYCTITAMCRFNFPAQSSICTVICVCQTCCPVLALQVRLR
jgi:hypothetical protein